MQNKNNETRRAAHRRERRKKGGEKKEGKKEGRGEDRKPQKKKFPAGRKSIVKQKKGSDTSRDSGKAACAEGGRICIIREKRAMQKEDRVREREDGGGGRGSYFRGRPHDSFNVKLERVMQRDGNFYPPCLPGKPERSNSKISTSGEDGIFFGARARNPTKCQFCFYIIEGKRSRACLISRRARNIFAKYIADYNLVMVLYKYNEKILL